MRRRKTMNSLTSVIESFAQPDTSSRKRGCLFYIGRGLKWFGIILIALVLLGVAYQAIAVELDKRNYPPRGQFYSVNGHQMHMVCMGEGSPALILQAGGLDESLGWYRIQRQLAEHTQVCAFDRPGLGWSEAVSGPREALTIIGELHTLLEEAGVSAPYVMAGHSYGAVLTRIYAAQYPEEVIGIALVDSQIMLPKHFANQSEFDAWKAGFAGLDQVFGVLTRIGLTRLTSASIFENAGYPPEIALELNARRSRNQTLDTDIEEKLNGYWALTEASAAAENLGDLPMAVLWAPESWVSTDTVIAGAPAAREEISTYSSNSITRIVEGADHSSILGNEQYAQRVSDAILDVIEAAQTGEPLAQ
jgi:pimeloyl-ACP methyl ester carboxylesterase